MSQKPNRGGKRAQKPKPLTEEEYLASKGVRDPFSGWVLDKMRGNRQLKTQKGQERFMAEAEKAESEYQERRNKAKEEYKKLLEQGKVRDKTSIEKAVDKAHGHPDNPSTQAARRMLEKRGIDWKTGKKLKNKGGD